MRTTKASEKAEIQGSTADLASARASLAAVEAASALAGGGPLDPLVELHDKQWVRVALAERRQNEAIDAHATAERRRSRIAGLRAFLRLPARAPPDETPSAAAPAIDSVASDESRRATIAFGAERPAHSEEEDLHPTRLDPSAADLERALADAALAKKNAERDARDA